MNEKIRKTKLGGMPYTEEEERQFRAIKSLVFRDEYLPSGYRKKRSQMKIHNINPAHLGEYLVNPENLMSFNSMNKDED